MEVSVLVLSKENDLQIRLIPDLEEPGADLFKSIAVDQEADKTLNIAGPFLIIRGHVNTRLVVERTGTVVFAESAGHEAQLNERFHAGFKDVIVGQAAGAEVFFGEFLRAGDREQFGEVGAGAHVIAEDAVKTDTLDAKLIMNEFQLTGIIGAKRELGMTAADAELPVFFVGNARSVLANGEFHGGDSSKRMIARKTSGERTDRKR